jgi:uncharacterized protein
MNRLAQATSPYLRQHADNPVDWWPWISEAFEEAKRRNVPIHLSVGYAACHWCHVMARETFSDPAIAAQLNRDFVSIKVDREERPEVDQIYMRALHALGQQGGWPLTMFLTPNAEPFWGGTYFPPEPRYGRPGFPQILEAVSGAWKTNDPAIIQNTEALKGHLTRKGAPPKSSIGGSPGPAVLDDAARTILSIWDMERGSFRGAPKFPNAPILDMLWRGWLRTGETSYRTAVLTTLTYLCQGGIYDHLGGGFARYSVDADWLVPHFEKMLYDNGLLLSQLSYAFRETQNPLFRARIDETVSWLAHDMQLAGGGLASSLDADTGHEEGLTYTWTWAELENALGERIGEVGQLYDGSPEGNWEGKIILNRLSPASRQWLGEAREAALRTIGDKLLRIRNQRPQPGRDDKVLADWNGLAISGLAQAARATANEEAEKLAVTAFRFVCGSMQRGDRLAHSFLDGALVWPGVATDYANMIRAALDLFSLTGGASYIERATAWFGVAQKHHFDFESEVYNLVADDGLALIAQPISVADEATPAATGTMASNSATLFMLTGANEYRDHAERLIAPLSSRTKEDPVSSASLQSGFDTLLRGRLAVVTGSSDAATALTVAVLREADPALVAVSPDPDQIPQGHPAAGKRPSKASAAVFLCDPFRCLPELVSRDEVTETLARTRRGLA